MAHYDPLDTIVAVASPPGGAARGIVRLSGPEVVACVGRVFCREGAGKGDSPIFANAKIGTVPGAKIGAVPGDALNLPVRPTVLAGSVRLGEEAGGREMPCELYLWPDGRGYTGQSVAELHAIGSPPLLDALVLACCRAGARPARPGEFTLRAFLSGRLDLTQAEAVLGVIDAADDAQLDAALAQLAGGLARPLARLREELADLLADLEAGLDFPDEDLPFVDRQQLRDRLAAARDAARALADQLAGRRRAGPAVQVVLVGWANTGKSSLFNALVGSRGALVSPRPGTTRDYLQAELDLDGAACVLVDAAGVQPVDGADDLDLQVALHEAAATARARADIEVLCLDGGREPNEWERAELAMNPAHNVVQPVVGLSATAGLSSSDFGTAGQASSGAPGGSRLPHRIVVQTKADLGPGNVPGAIRTSSATGEGLAALRARLREMAIEVGRGDAVAATAARCGRSIHEAVEALDRAVALADHAGGEELLATEIRLALDHLGELSGAVHTDDVLDRVFARFCVGK
ncbi:MAG: 50S ribosome-binding GTPase [Pirellulales bacterium]|nr:50S ribosome-binding GTPase [Pirellulales bacterium]